jgi:hypothetical protein
MLMIELPNLEFHAAHACNLYCAQCSHYSNFHAGGIVSLEEARANFDAWKGRLAPKRIAILGGEPTLNPELISIIELARQSFPNAEGLFVTNGFFLDRHPDLPRVLIDNQFRMDVSQHGRAPEYMKRFRLVRQQLRQWRTAYPKLQINIRKSHRGWRQQYRIVDGRPMPFDSDPRAAWSICLQRTCTQLYKQCLWKCPALAYHAIMSRKLKLDNEPAWQLFRDYQACSPAASDDQVVDFLATEEVPSCALCPARKIPFRHSDPLHSQRKP